MLWHNIGLHYIKKEIILVLNVYLRNIVLLSGIIYIEAHAEMCMLQ